MELIWTRVSTRLWTTQVEGRLFRIERTGTARQSGHVRAREVDKYNKTVEDRDVLVKNAQAGKGVIASWLKGECFECHMADGLHELTCSQPRQANLRREADQRAKDRTLTGHGWSRQ